MHYVPRLILSALLATGMTGGVRAMEDVPHSDVAGAAEYKRADTSFYAKGDVLRAHPGAVVIKQGEYIKTGESYFFTPKKKAPKDMYAETLSDWIEPITPPDMPASLGVPPDAMQIREPQGDVRVALPSAPTSFAPVTAGMTLPNGAVLKTGDNGTAAVLFGGVDSARLMPNSEAAVQQTVTTDARSVEVDLTAGGVFSKVGTQVGVKGVYEVHTPSGNATAQGGDFATIVANSRTDVWVAQGTVSLEHPDSKIAETVTSDGAGPLKIMRFPAIADPHASFLADTETLSLVLNFIPLADQKIKALRDKLAGGATLTANEQAYLARLKKVPCVVKLALVEPPAPALKPAVAMDVAPLPAPAPAAPMVPVEVALRPDGQVDLMGQTMDLAELKTRLAAIAQQNPAQALLIKGREKVSHDQFAKVRAIYRALHLKAVAALPAPANPTNPPVGLPAVVAPLPAPAPAPAPLPVDASLTGPMAAPSVAPAPVAVAPATPDKSKPITLRVRTDGKINFQKATFTLEQLRPRLVALAKVTPDQALVIRAGKSVSYDEVEPVLAACRDAGFQSINVSAPPPSAAFNPPESPEHPADNLPAPGLLMHPSMAPRTGDAPPASNPTPESTPSTNTPAPSVP